MFFVKTKIEEILGAWKDKNVTGYKEIVGFLGFCFPHIILIGNLQWKIIYYILIISKAA